MIVGALALSTAFVYLASRRTSVAAMPDYEVFLGETGESKNDLPKSRFFIA
jgi:hypothetical protein